MKRSHGQTGIRVTAGKTENVDYILKERLEVWQDRTRADCEAHSNNQYLLMEFTACEKPVSRSVLPPWSCYSCWPKTHLESPCEDMNGLQCDMQTTLAINLKPFSLPSLPSISSVIAYAQLVYYIESPNFMKIRNPLELWLEVLGLGKCCSEMRGWKAGRSKQELSKT